MTADIISEKELGGYKVSCDLSYLWRPHFTSAILEAHWKKKVTEFLHKRYRIALVFIGLFALLWIVFFSVQLPVSPDGHHPTEPLTSDWLAIESVKYSIGYILGAVVLFCILLLFLILTFCKFYRKIAHALSIILTLLLMSVSCILAVGLYLDNTLGISTISFVAQFGLSAIVVLVVYTLSRLDIRFSIVICTLYMIVLEALSTVLSSRINSQFVVDNSAHINYIKLFTMSTTGRLFFHICLNIAGITTAYLSQIRLHDTYWRIGQCVLARRLLDTERDIEEKTIHSMLPHAFVDDLLSAQVQIAYIIDMEVHRGDQTVPPLLKYISAPFKLCSMDRVSILYADIVGFTKLSSSLSASELVGILNEMFSEFDELAQRAKCETITTLGDSYICVSGCPKQDAGHADNCVELGLSIVKSLEENRKKTSRSIEMRIGIHTGSVLCGILGTKRFKFDVWSRDVTIANKIESVGKPSKVIVSSATKVYLSSMYTTEEYIVQDKPIELKYLSLYVASRYYKRSLPVGSTSMVWKHRIKDIESFGKGHHLDDKETSKNEMTDWSVDKKDSNTLRDILKRRMSLSLEINEQPAISLRDSLSRQSHLQQCASYTEVANPRRQHEIGLDKKIVELMEAEKVNFDSYFDPRLKFFTAFFANKELESRYRNHGRDLVDPQKGTAMETELGFHLTKFSYLVDVIALMIIFILIMIGSAISLGGGTAFIYTSTPLYQSWLIILIFGLITQSIILACVLAIYIPDRFPKKFADLSQYMINWYVRSFVALYLIYYPMCIVIVTLTQCYSTGFSSIEDLLHVQMSLYITIIVLICSINFMGVVDIAKIVGGVCSAALTVGLIAGVHLHMCGVKLTTNSTSTVSGTVVPNRNYTAQESQLNILHNYYNRHITPEAVILFLLILAILTVVNRMSEVSVRLSFVGRIEAAANKQFTRQQKNQVEWLLYNIIPPHVAMELKSSGRYSCNHDCVGVIFASIVNFNDLRWEGEEASFRLLNRIIREYDMLLDRAHFSLVEKIKTIGSTYMAASGLNLPNTADKVSHLVQLVNFALQLNDVLRQVNILVPGFAFHLRIGLNYGPVTSGVVGSRKLMYDIWGDTVNVASRMDSTGKVFKIHMPEKCLTMLAPYITWEVNRTVDVKGKGSMKTVFVTGRK